MFFINHIDFGKDSTSIIEIDGELNSESSPDFDEYIDKLLENNVIYMLIDMKNLNYISSEGIGAVLMIQKKVSEKNGFAIFFNLNFEVFSLFRLLGFDKVLTIASNRAEALQILDKRIELFPDKGELYDYDDFTLSEQKDKEDEFASFNIDNVEPLELKSIINEYDEINSFENFVIECIRCNSLIRINEFGNHLCPFCDAEFTVTDEKKAVFKIKDNRS
ncbi:MAG: STAS domain-containing protein [Spirochaetes bacterium]|nr:STAS domain-containing protein [Spirochaetota bacterium]